MNKKTSKEVQVQVKDNNNALDLQEKWGKTMQLTSNNKMT